MFSCASCRNGPPSRCVQWCCLDKCAFVAMKYCAEGQLCVFVNSKIGGRCLVWAMCFGKRTAVLIHSWCGYPVLWSITKIRERVAKFIMFATLASFAGRCILREGAGGFFFFLLCCGCGGVANEQSILMHACTRWMFQCCDYEDKWCSCGAKFIFATLAKLSVVVVFGVVRSCIWWGYEGERACMYEVNISVLWLRR